MRDSENGSGLLQILLLFVLAGIISGTGYFVYKSQKATNKSLDNANQNLTQLSSSNSSNQMIPEQEENSWLEYEPSDKAFSIRIPDGWRAIILYDNLYVRDAEKMVYIPGADTSIEMLSEGGWDGPSPFSVYYPKQNYDQIVKEGTLQEVITTASGHKAEKYMYVQESEPDGIGFQQGDRVYNYYFGADAKYVQVQYVVNQGQTDQFKLIDKIVRTFKAN